MCEYKIWFLFFPVFRIRNLHRSAFFLIILKKRHSCTSCEKIDVVPLFLVCFFGSEIETLFTLCVRYTLCAGGPSLGAKSRLSDDFAQKYFLITPFGNGNVGRGPRDLLESGL
jgi:hypothetical protein